MVQIELLEKVREVAESKLNELYLDQHMPLEVRNLLNEISEALDRL